MQPSGSGSRRPRKPRQAQQRTGAGGIEGRHTRVQASRDGLRDQTRGPAVGAKVSQERAETLFCEFCGPTGRRGRAGRRVGAVQDQGRHFAPEALQDLIRVEAHGPPLRDPEGGSDKLEMFRSAEGAGAGANSDWFMGHAANISSRKT